MKQMYMTVWWQAATKTNISPAGVMETNGALRNMLWTPDTDEPSVLLATHKHLAHTSVIATIMASINGPMQ